MERIITPDYLDIVPCSKGLVYIKYDILEDGTEKRSFFSYDVISKKSVPITPGVYFLNKFGSNFKIILEQLEDPISCETATIQNDFIVVMYPTGEMGIFNIDGTLIWTGDLSYHDSPVCSVTTDDKCIWSVVPDKNSIVRYSPSQNKFMLRIGGNSSTTFSKPIDIKLFDNSLFVCNYDSFKIRKINIVDYTVKDYLLFDEPVKKYFKILDKEIVAWESGVYII